MMEFRVERRPQDAEMRALFAAFDKDSSGYIDADELKSTMTDVGMPVTAKDVQIMLKEVGVQGHGRIYYEGTLVRAFVVSGYMIALLSKKKVALISQRPRIPAMDG